MTDEELKTIREEYQDDTTAMELCGEIDALNAKVRILQSFIERNAVPLMWHKRRMYSLDERR